MRKLVVNDFSCIHKASLELSQLTLIIGPQASGKSVLCKLAYFFLDAAQQQHSNIARNDPFERFTENLKERFVKWFPVSAWGGKRFKIEFQAGDFCIEIVRKKYGDNVSDDFRVKISKQFQIQYAELCKLTSVKDQQKNSREIWEFDWELRQATTKSLKKLMGTDSIDYQTFVPAGRSFFTSIGKAIAAFEQGQVLDPLILKFGRMYTSLRDHQMFIRAEKSSASSVRKTIEKSMAELMGGVIERDGENDFIRSNDGRKIPISALSSGQQELLPLTFFMPQLYSENSQLQYFIEEPEAHLFPTAQSKLIESLVIASSNQTSGSSLVLTTHSPYVLTKVNNLLKSGLITRKLNEVQRKTLDQIIPKKAWLQVKNVRAYAIQNGVLSSIIEDDGLISSDYLDEASGELSEEFGQLLALEAGLE